MRSNLERFQVTKLCPFQEKIRRQYLSTNVRGKYCLIMWVHINNCSLNYERMVATLLLLILGHPNFFFLIGNGQRDIVYTVKQSSLPVQLAE